MPLSRKRSSLYAAVAIVCLLANSIVVAAAEQDLPEMGSAANAAVSLDEEYRVGLMVVRGMRDSGQILEDPEVSEYIQSIGHRISSHADEGAHQFYYFVVRDPSINAFALPGGFIAIHSGLLLATRNENELAGVLAHETAHVTQRHLARGLIDQSHASLVSTAAMLAAILLGATAGRGSPDAMQGAIVASQGAAIQHQLNYSRANEYEADRIGIGTMAAAGFDPLGMPSFFETIAHTEGNPAYNSFEFLQNHPVTSDRVAESRARAEQLGRIRSTDSETYGLTRERLRSLVGTPEAARAYYAGLLKNGSGTTPEQRYGRAVAEIAAGNAAAAMPELKSLVAEYPKITQYYGALGQAQLAAGQSKESKATLEKALLLFPRNVPLTIRLAETLMRSGDNKQAHTLLLDLFNVVEPTPDQARLIANAANAAGDIADSYYYMSEFYIMSGELMMASNQLQLALSLPGTNAIQRARFSARLEEIRAALPKEQRGARPDEGGDRGRRGGGGDDSGRRPRSN
jgi:beta-barrel assembly-enhancing protease